MGRYAYRQPPRRPRQGGGCLPVLLAALAIGGLLALLYAVALRPLFSQAVADTIGGPAAPVPTLMATGASQPQAQAPDQAVIAQAGSVMPTAVAALPPGQLVISDADINGFIAASPGAIAPLESASVSFTPGAARAQLSAYGVSSTATIGLAAQDGRIVVTSAQLDAPLSYLISGPDIARALADRLNTELAAQGRRVDELRIEAGQLILVTS